jgi:hypothetical protein
MVKFYKTIKLKKMELKFEKNAIEALKIMENTNNDLYLT